MLSIVETSKFSALSASIKEDFSKLRDIEWELADKLKILEEERLYLDGGYQSFEDYCQAELSGDDGYRKARDLLNAKRVRDSVPDGRLKSLISKPSHTRPLLKLVRTPEKISEAVEIASQNNPTPTAIDFAQAVNQIAPNKKHTAKSEISQTQLRKNVRVSSQLHPRYGEEGMIASDPPNNWQQIVEFSDGSREAIADRDLDFGELVISTKPRTYTQAEFDEAIVHIKEECKRTIDRLESDILCRVSSTIRDELERETREELQAAQNFVDELRQKNIDLQLQLGQMQHLQALKQENDDLKIENERLKEAAKESALNQWDNTFSTQAAKVLNKEVLERLNAQEPELHLTSLSKQLPPPDQMPEALKLLKLFIDLLVAPALESYRETLGNASHWSEFEPTATFWIAIKDIVWAKLTPDERSKIINLKKQSDKDEFKIGDRVVPAPDCDPYYAEYGCTGEVVAIVFGDFMIRWKRENGTGFEKRHAKKELKLLKEANHAA